MKRIGKALVLLLIICFIILYFSYKNGYYIKRNEEISILTEEKIKEYENDLKNGVDVTKKDYIVTRDNYDNSSTRFLLRLSNKIENGFDKLIKFIFKRIGERINE